MSQSLSISHPLSMYDELPVPLKKQLGKIEEHFTNEDRIKELAERVYRKMSKEATLKKRSFSKTEYRKTALHIAMFLAIESSYFLSPRWYKYIQCYNPKGSLIQLDNRISKGKHVAVMSGKLNGETPVVVKWYQSNRRDTLYEINIYKKLREIGCKTPWFSSSYSFWDFPILVLEKLKPLTKDDNEFEMGAQILEQLKMLHDNIGIHNDVKPGNVMKRDVKGTPEYLMIDHGGVATKKLSYGYRRWIWSPKWTSQEPHVHKQLTTAKNDFIELGYTMKTMQNWRTHEKSVRSGFTGRLLKFMNRVDQVNPRQIVAKDYSDLIKILRE